MRACGSTELYDWKAPWVISDRRPPSSPNFDSMCSAKVFLALRACGIFKWPTTLPAHEIDPAILLFVASTLVEISH